MSKKAVLLSTELTQDYYLQKILEAENFHFYEYLEEGTEIADLIYGEISHYLKVERGLIAGSIGKGTWLGIKQHTDFDIVLLFNLSKEGTPPSDIGILNAIAEIIRNFQEDDLPFEILKQTKYTIKCKYYTNEFDWITFDIVPGLNFIPYPSKRDKQHALTQMNETFKYIQEHGGNDRLPFMSASLAEAVVEFVRGEDEFTHRVIKLGKLWSKRQVSEVKVGKINGRSYTMEIIAIKAARTEKSMEGKKRSLAGAFERFLNVWAQSREDIKVIFPFRANKTLRPSFMQYRRMSIQGGVVLDPCNPWNNLLTAFDDEQFGAFQEAAQRSLRFMRHYPAKPGITLCFTDWEEYSNRTDPRMPKETCCAIS